MLKKISHKIIFSYLLIFLSFVFILIFFINRQIYNIHLDFLKKNMIEKIDFIELNLQDSKINLNSPSNILSKNISQISKIINLRITIVSKKGMVLADSFVKDIFSMDNHKYRIEIMRAFKIGTGSSIRYSHTLKIDMLYVAKRYKNDVIRLSKPLYSIQKSLARTKKIILILAIFVFLSASILVILISKKITAPFKEIVDFAYKFSKGNLEKRILDYNDDEIGLLQKSLNKMADLIVEKIKSMEIEQKKLVLTIENISDGIAVINQSHQILLINSSFKEVLGIKKDVSQRIYYEVFRNNKLNSEINNSIKNKEIKKFSEKFLTGKICDIRLKPILEEEKFYGIIVALHDISEQEKLNRIKSELIGNMSHEFKTPIAILKGYLETVIENLNNKKLTKDFLTKALQNVDRQNLLVNDIVNLNRIESSTDFPLEEINLSEILDSCVEILYSKSERKSIELNSDYKKGNEIFIITGNKFLVEQIFFNLIDNAIIYNKQYGKIFIDVKSNEPLTVCIRDTGIGIPEKSLNKVFERFYRVDKSRSRETGGTGLGLAIVKNSVELLGWKISVSSDYNGTTFFVVIKR